MSLIGNFAAKIGLRERRKDSRVPTRGLEAFCTRGGERMAGRIKDISPAGICLELRESLPPGTQVELTLRRRSCEEDECGAQVSIPSRVIRADGAEAGLEFLNEHVNAAGWSGLVLKAAQLSRRNDGVRVFRIARALAFLQRISPAGSEYFLKAITGGMSYDGEERALEIVLQAEDMLERRRQRLKRGVDSNLIRRIVEHGVNLDSWEADVVRCWGGLLASSSLEGSEDGESLVFAALLSKLEQGAIRILTAGCEKAMVTGWDAGFVFPGGIHCGIEEMKRIVGARDTMAVDWGLNRLGEFGLLKESRKLSSFEMLRQIDITPTGLGLKLYARCSGRLEVPDVRMAGGNAA